MRRPFSIFLLAFIGFIDYLGIGLVFPIFPVLLFDSEFSVFSLEVTPALRGFWMGLLIALGPLAQFFLSPLFGSLSDQKGRNPILMIGLLSGVMGYALGVLGVAGGSLILLCAYRLLFGVSAATASVVQAAIADISPSNSKGQSFAWYSMAQGLGFTVGPFVGGRLSDDSLCSWFSLSTPFYFGLICSLVCLVLIHFFLQETNRNIKVEKLDFFKGIRQAKRAFKHPVLRMSFIGMFFFLCGWDYFEEFIGVYLSQVLGFSTGKMGNYFGLQGLYYAISAGILIRPLLKKFSNEKLLVIAMLAGAASVIPTGFFGDAFSIWFFAPFLMFFGALYFPTASTYISNQARPGEQGELLGIYHSIYAIALVVSPFFSGTLAGVVPKIPIYLGAALMLVGSGVFAGGLVLRNKSSEPFDQGRKP